MELPKSCELDPDGDLTLILLDHCDTDSYLVDHLKKSISSNMRKSRGIKRSLSGQFKNVVPTSSSSVVGQDNPPEADDCGTHKIRLKVSSKHLTLASPVFKALLRGGFAESRDLDAGSPAEVHLPDDNAVALWLLLYILHGQLTRLPRKLNLTTLTQIAVLVDKYELHEATEKITDEWFARSKKRSTAEYEHHSDEVLQLLCVSWVFRKHTAFSNTTRLAILYSKGDLATIVADDLPIPAEVFGE
jgi:hypothetical protein